MIGGRTFRQLFAGSLICALLGLGASAAAWMIRPQAFFPAWLAGFCWSLSLPLGAIGLLRIHDLTGGRWQAIARAPLEAAASTMPLFLVLFLPIIAGLGVLYPWTGSQLQLPNRWYLNLDFFGARAALYFLVWNFLALAEFRRWRLGGARASQPASALALILLALSVTYASIDWMMSIEPDWFSTIYAMMVGSGWFVASLSFVLLFIVLSPRPSGIDNETFSHHLSRLATILIAVDIFWAYTAFSQWLIIWEENLHAEITWYIDRLNRGWRELILAIIALHILIPLFTLIWGPAKRNPKVVGAICVFVLGGELLQMWWLILPSFHGAAFGWAEPAAAIGIGGLWFSAFLWRLRFAAPAGLRGAPTTEDAGP